MARKRVRRKARRTSIDPRWLVFIAETWAKTNMGPPRGWAPRGERRKGKGPFDHWNTMTFVAALRHDRIDGSWVYDGPIDAAAFLAHVAGVLVLPSSRATWSSWAI